MKIAFLFLTIDNLYFQDLWKIYFKNNMDMINIYMHPKLPDNVTYLNNNIIKNLKKTIWGKLVDAEISLLETALSDDKDNYYFILLSESCLPIKNFKKLYNFLQKNKKYSYINFVGNNNLEKQFKYKHSQWFCLNRHHVKKLLLQKKKILNYYNKIYTGDEYIFNSILPDKNIKDMALTYINWDKLEEGKDIHNKIKQLWQEYDLSKDEQIKIEIERLKIIRDKYSKHPKEYDKLTNDEIKEITNNKAFFYRKFTKDSSIVDIFDKLME
jgi:hypothetical protein